MSLPRPRSLNGLILVGFGLVAVPLLIAVVWALINLDRLAEHSEQLIVSGVTAAENNRALAQRVGSFERLARQYLVLRTEDSRSLVRQDLESIQGTIDLILPLAELADATELARSIPERAARIVHGLQESIRRAQRVSAWQTAALVPGTVVIVLFFTLLVARPIRQIDSAIHQLGQSGFSKSIEVKGPTDLERLGRQLEWLRVRLLELAQEKNRFLRHMSHELKTPLANIREGTELLLDGTVGELDPPQREVTDILRQNGLKLQRLIENLLSFSAWQTKNEVLTLTRFPLRTLIISVVKAQRLALKSAQIQLRLQVEDFVITADRDKMRTVLDNLLSNAAKFTPKGGIITIRARSQTGSFVLEFADTGPGIPEDEGPRIFDAFFQGKQRQGGHIAGTGIGLSVVLECIQAHDGVIELVDSDEFPGAHFRIRIPQKQTIQNQRMAASA
jgi:two-component system sensor histidine kinase GlrK